MRGYINQPSVAVTLVVVNSSLCFKRQWHTAGLVFSHTASATTIQWPCSLPCILKNKNFKFCPVPLCAKLEPRL